MQDPVASHDVNATGTVNVLEAARKHGSPQVIVASSSAVVSSPQATRLSAITRASRHARNFFIDFVLQFSFAHLVGRRDFI